MENKIIKCSLKKHTEIDAISYCHECKLYLCNKCQNHHEEIHENHNLIDLKKDLNEIFIDTCKQSNHNNYKVEFFCETHNTLCCAACLSKIKNEIYGQHFDCKVYSLKEIKDDKKSKLKENIKFLEDLSNNFEQSINKLKILVEKINKDKEELKLKVQQIFTKIRTALNEREDKLLQEIDEKFDKIYIKEDIIKESEKLPYKLKISLEKGKKIEKEWNDNNLNSIVNDCINIENNIKEIKTINNIIDENKLNKKPKIYFSLGEDKINQFLDTIKSFGEIDEKQSNLDLYKDFDIKSKEPKIILENHKDYVWCLTKINDGRLVSGSYDALIIIYNKKTYKPDIIIKEHKEGVCCIIQLFSGKLASCSKDNTINIFNIKGNEYEIFQTLTFHNGEVYKIIELKNNTLVSCSSDSSIKLYLNENLKYKVDFNIKTSDSCYSIIQTKENELCYSENSKIYFYDLANKSIKASITDISKSDNCFREWFIVITPNLLLIPGINKISIVDINRYKIIKIIEVPGSDYIFGTCMLNKDMVIIGSKLNIYQWKIEGDNLILFSKKENAHKSYINTLLNLGDGYIASGCEDSTISIW